MRTERGTRRACSERIERQIETRRSLRSAWKIICQWLVEDLRGDRVTAHWIGYLVVEALPEEVA